MIHPSAEVHSSNIGANTNIWQYCVVLAGARIGQDCNLCAHVFIENDVIVGDRVTIKSGTQLWDGICVENDVFIGPNVSFTNDAFPRSKQQRSLCQPTIVHQGASIGANATLLPGIRIGSNAMIGAGAVVTRDVPANGIVRGNPARICGYVNAPQAPVSEANAPEIPQQIAAMAGATLYTLPFYRDLRGSLAVCECSKLLPFPVERVFWVFHVPNKEIRGEHAHFQCHQFLICVSGSIRLLLDDGRQRSEIHLAQPNLGVHIPPMTWAVQYQYSADAVLLVFTSHAYDAADYIRDYDTFRALATAGNPRP